MTKRIHYQVLDKLQPVGSYKSWKQRRIYLLGQEAGDVGCDGSYWLLLVLRFSKTICLYYSGLLCSMLASTHFCPIMPWQPTHLFSISSCFDISRPSKKNILMLSLSYCRCFLCTVFFKLWIFIPRLCVVSCTRPF